MRLLLRLPPDSLLPGQMPAQEASCETPRFQCQAFPGFLKNRIYLNLGKRSRTRKFLRRHASIAALEAHFNEKSVTFDRDQRSERPDLNETSHPDINVGAVKTNVESAQTTARRI